MKKKILSIMIVLVLMLSAFCLSACKNDEPAIEEKNEMTLYVQKSNDLNSSDINSYDKYTINLDELSSPYRMSDILDSKDIDYTCEDNVVTKVGQLSFGFEGDVLYEIYFYSSVISDQVVNNEIKKIATIDGKELVSVNKLVINDELELEKPDDFISIVKGCTICINVVATS